jgi:hypothetical protein
MFQFIKFKSWINTSKICYEYLCQNESYFAMELVEQYNKEHIHIRLMCINPYAIHILSRYTINDVGYQIRYSDLCENSNAVKLIEEMINNFPNYVDWRLLSKNKNAIHLLKDNLDKVCWYYLSENENAISILEENIDKVCWTYLSKNKNAIHLLKDNLDKVCWYYLSGNENAISILEENIDKIVWCTLSQNNNLELFISKHPEHINLLDWDAVSNNEYCIRLIENNLDNVEWDSLLSNPSAIDLIEKNVDKVNDLYYNQIFLNPNIFTYDYENMICQYKDELLSIFYHPDNYHLLDDLGLK